MADFRFERFLLTSGTWREVDDEMGKVVTGQAVERLRDIGPREARDGRQPEGSPSPYVDDPRRRR